jgi:hypothetical protein
VPFPQARFRASLCGLFAAGIAACGGTLDPDGGELPTPSEACATQSILQLAVGTHAIVDPSASGGCLRIPQAGAGGARYLLVLASTNGTKSSNGIQGPYLLRASTPVAAVAAPEPLLPGVSPVLGGLRTGSVGARFGATLRDLERQLAADPRNRPLRTVAANLVLAPPVGDVKSFKVCNNLTCSSFGTVQATARYVGTHAAVYIDNEVPQSDPLQQSDFDNLGHAFDLYHYPIDTTAFGRESDIDGNGVVIILMTDAVNDLTPDCTNGRVIGYFFGGDLLTGANSNRAEIFYTLVPQPAHATNCSVVTRTAAVNNLKPTLIHEFQHMISFNQHVLLRSGSSEETWLNEALSHFAEELGGRLVPEAECVAAGFTSCRSQYTSGDILDSYDYLKDTESHYLVFPSSSQGTLAERGAVWLFLRWTLDQFSPDTILGTPTTRALVATSQTGVTNLTAVTGGVFSEMVPRWLLAAYLDDGAELPSEPTGFLRFKSWGLRSIWTNPANANVFPGGFPLVPLAIADDFSRAGTLKAGSGRHFLITQAAGATLLDLQVLKSTAGAQLDPTLQARFGVVRIR